MQKKMKVMLKKDIIGKEKQKNIESKKMTSDHNKKYFTFEKIKENNNSNNNNNKKQTKNVTKVNDQFLSMVTL